MFTPNSEFRIPNFDAAFTLIEVVLVAVVLAILLTASIPKFRQTAEQLRAEGAAFELTQLLRFARERAVSDSRTVVWTWDEAARRARVVSEPGSEEDGMGLSEPSQTETAVESSRLPDGLAVEVTRHDTWVDCRCVRFFPQGTSEATTLNLRLGTRVYTVTVNETTGQAILAAGIPSR